MAETTRGQTRWQRAHSDWTGLQWRDALGGLPGIAIAVAVLVLAEFSGETTVAAVIVFGAGVVGALSWALLQLVWAWLQAPHNMVMDELDSIHETLRGRLGPGLAPEDGDLRRYAVLTKSDLLDGRHLLTQAVNDGAFWPHGGLPSGKWAISEETLAGDPRAAAAYESVTEAFRVIAPIHDRVTEVQGNWENAKRYVSGVKLATPSEAELDAMREAVLRIDRAIKDLDALISEIVRGT